MVDVWVLGGTGRTGRGVADALARGGLRPVLVGRDAARLGAAARDGAYGTVVAADVAAMAQALTDARPAVVVNTVGPFTRTMPVVVDACLAGGSHYVDLANDLAAVLALLGRSAAAERAGCTLVTGAGFGVVATESVVTRLCEHAARRPVSVRTDMVPSLEVQAGPVGEALAATLVEGLPGVPGGRRFGGRRYSGGRLARASLGGGGSTLVTPDGDEVSTGLMPLGELVAARRASGADEVGSGSSEAPSRPLVRAALTVGGGLLGLRAVRDLATRRLSGVRFAARPAPRAHSWGHAVVGWADGSTSEGWLRLPEAQAATVGIAAEVARRLARGDGRPGAWTPVALLGTGLATSVGGTFVDDAATTG